MSPFWFLRRKKEKKPTGAEPVHGQPREWEVPGDFDSIQQAIRSAGSGDVIVVHPGHYQERINFLGKALTVRGTDPRRARVVADTVLDGGGRGCVVVFESGESEGARLAGFTITNGRSSITHDHPGGGITITNESRPIIERNVISQNYTSLDGGGLHIDHSWPVVRHNRIEANRAGGAGGGLHIGSDYTPPTDQPAPLATRDAYAQFLDRGAPAASPIAMQSGEAPDPGQLATAFVGVPGDTEADRPRAVIEGNTIVGNDALSGGGIHVSDEAPTINGNALRNNHAQRGGGMTFWDNSRPIVGKNHVVGNSADLEGGGVMVEWGAAPAIVANQLVDNQSPRGAAVSVAPSAHPVIEGNRFRDNHGSGEALFLWPKAAPKVEDNRFESKS